MNGPELNRIVETVLQHEVEKAELNAIKESKEIERESLQAAAQRIETITHNVESIDDLFNEIDVMMGQAGINVEALRAQQYRAMGQVLDHEFSQDNIRDIIRENLLIHTHGGGTLSRIKPGTQAEVQFVNQVQQELFKALSAEVPEVAKHMPSIGKGGGVSSENDRSERRPHSHVQPGLGSK